MLADFAFVGFTTLLALITYYPQARRVLLTGAASGVPAVGLLIGSVDYAAWVWYFFATGEPIVGVGTAVESIIWLWLAYLVVQARGGVRRNELFMVGGVALGLFLIGLASPILMGLALGFSVILVDAPSVWEAWRAPAIGSISTTTWVLTFLTGGVWTWWGITNASMGAWFYGIVVTLGAVGVLSALYFRPHARAMTRPPIQFSGAPITPSLTASTAD